MLLIYAQFLLIILVCLISSFSDCSTKKIYNKNLLIFLILSSITYLILFNFIKFDNIYLYLINLFISTIVSYLFYYYKIWAAGDAKLFILVIYMIPYSVYKISNKMIFPALYIIMIIFSVAFLCIIIESLYLVIIKSKKITFKSYFNNDIFSYLFLYIEGFLVSNIINTICYNLFYNFYVNNATLLYLVNIAFIFYIYKISEKIKVRNVILISALIINLYFIINGMFLLNSFNYKNIIVIFLIILLREVCNLYNYKEISVNELKEGMVLSYSTVISFYGSNIKKLPHFTTEDTDSRITNEQVESIKRWSKSKKGKDSIIIVRHIPFAPFIFIGSVIYFLLKII